MIKIGIIGWRGIVGSTLLNRINSSLINKYSEIYLFSTNKLLFNKKIFSAFNLKLLLYMDIIVSCQGSDYTRIILKKILSKKWKGYWIDASSFLRMHKENCLILDPINEKMLLKEIKTKKIFSGANCTVSLCLLSLKGLLDLNLIDWISCNTYQAISGAGSSLIKKTMNETFNLNNFNTNFINLEKKIKFNFNDKKPLFLNVIPWIDKKVNFSQTKEEWKSQAEACKILNRKILIDSNCIRISSLRCHSQVFTVKLNKNISLNNVYENLNYKYLNLIKNDFYNTSNFLNPFYVNGKLKIFLGRIKKSTFDKKIFHFFSVGDQLLWGAAEPIKRFLEILIKYLL